MAKRESKPFPVTLRDYSRMRCREQQPWDYKLQPYNNTHSRTIGSENLLEALDAHILVCARAGNPSILRFPAI